MQRQFLLSAFLLFVLSALPPRAAARPTDEAGSYDALRSLHLKPRQELILQRKDGVDVHGRFIRLDDRTDSIHLRRFVPDEGRIRTEQVPLGTTMELRAVAFDPSEGYPILGALIGLGVGAAIGFIAGENPTGGNLERYDTRVISAGLGGLIGAPLGLMIGALVAPNRRTETVLWRRDHE